MTSPAAKSLAEFILNKDYPPEMKVSLKLLVEINGQIYQQSLAGSVDTLTPLIIEIYTSWHQIAKKKREEQLAIPAGRRASQRLLMKKPESGPTTDVSPSETPTLPSSETRSVSPPPSSPEKVEQSVNNVETPMPSENISEISGAGALLNLKALKKIRRSSLSSKPDDEVPQTKSSSPAQAKSPKKKGGSWIQRARSSSQTTSEVEEGNEGTKSPTSEMEEIREEKEKPKAKEGKEAPRIPKVVPGRKPNVNQKRFMEVVTDHSEFEPGDEVTGSMAISLEKPMINVGSIVVTLKGVESCFGGLEMKSLDQAVQDFDSRFNASTFFTVSTTVWEASSPARTYLKGQHFFPFSLKLPKMLPQSFCVFSTAPNVNHLASVFYYLEASTVAYDQTKKISPAKAQKTLLLSQPVEILVFGLHPEKLMKTPPSASINQSFKIQRTSGVVEGSIQIPKPDIFLGRPTNLQISLQNSLPDQLQRVWVFIEQIVMSVKEQKELAKDRYSLFSKKYLPTEIQANMITKCSIEPPLQNYEAFYTKPKDVPLIPSATGLNVSISHNLLVLLSFTDQGKKDSLLRVPIKVFETPLN